MSVQPAIHARAVLDMAYGARRQIAVGAYLHVREERAHGSSLYRCTTPVLQSIAPYTMAVAQSPYLSTARRSTIPHTAYGNRRATGVGWYRAVPALVATYATSVPDIA
eukprot:3436253-Rhodomonas_salina.5